PGRIRVPRAVARQVLGVVAERLVAGVVLVRDPQYVVAIADAPQRRERIAKTEVDAADTTDGIVVRRLSGLRVAAHSPEPVAAADVLRQFLHQAAGEVRIHQSLDRLERASVSTSVSQRGCGDTAETDGGGHGGSPWKCV